MKWTKVNGGWLDEDNNFMTDDEQEKLEAQIELQDEEN